MENPDSGFVPSPEAASDDSASLVRPLAVRPEPDRDSAPAGADNDILYWRGVADGIARAGGAVPPEVAERAAGGGRSGSLDILAFDPVPLRYRSDGLTPERQRAYVEALADCGVAREAAARVGVSEQAVSQARRRADGRSFDLACEAAHRLGARGLRSVAFERAILGTIRGHYYHGELVSQERVFDNRLLIYLLGRSEHLLDPPEESGRICGQWQPWMDALEQGLAPPALEAVAQPAATEADEPQEELSDEQVWLEEGVWWTLFPPPEGFDGEEEGEFGSSTYQRTLTAEEEEALRAKRADSDEQELARCCAMRDRLFGLAPRGGPGLSASRQAETSETSAARLGEPPVERGPESSNTAPDIHSGGGSG